MQSEENGTAEIVNENQSGAVGASPVASAGPTFAEAVAPLPPVPDAPVAEVPETGVTSAKYADLLATVNKQGDVIAGMERSLKSLADAVSYLTSGTGSAISRLVADNERISGAVSQLAAADAQRSDTGAVLTDAEAEHIRFVLNKYHAHERV